MIIDFQNLREILKEDPEKGLSISGKDLIPKEQLTIRKYPVLKNYLVDDSIDTIIQHNLEWTRGEREKPIFKFAYIMLPTLCNQRCIGCFTGKDKNKLPKELSGEIYSDKTLEDIISFLKNHGAESIVYSGGGELFTWKGASNYIDKITNAGLGINIFTNGSLLSEENIRRLSKKDITLMFSIRDTNELDHNNSINNKGFRKSLHALDYALKYGFNKENRLAVEIPVIKTNQERILYDFIPAMRTLGIIPMVEEFILKETILDLNIYHNFNECREFFIKASEIDRKFGYDFRPIDGQRMLAQPKCKRPLYSFTVYPNGDVTDCPSNSINYGNIYKNSLKDIVYSEKFKESLRQHQYCPCSVFYTDSKNTISPKSLGVIK